MRLIQGLNAMLIGRGYGLLLRELRLPRVRTLGWPPTKCTTTITLNRAAKKHQTEMNQKA